MGCHLTCRSVCGAEGNAHLSRETEAAEETDTWTVACHASQGHGHNTWELPRPTPPGADKAEFPPRAVNRQSFLRGAILGLRPQPGTCQENQHLCGLLEERRRNPRVNSWLMKTIAQRERRSDTSDFSGFQILYIQIGSEFGGTVHAQTQFHKQGSALAGRSMLLILEARVLLGKRTPHELTVFAKGLTTAPRTGTTEARH